MANPENIIGKGNRFSSTNQPQRNGRKPSTYALIKKLFGTDAEAELSKEDYYKLIAYLLERPIDDLQKLAKDKSAIKGRGLSATTAEPPRTKKDNHLVVFFL